MNLNKKEEKGHIDMGKKGNKYKDNILKANQLLIIIY